MAEIPKSRYILQRANAEVAKILDLKAILYDILAIETTQITNISGGNDIGLLTIVSGTTDGINTSFEFSQAPTQVFWNGQKLIEGASVNGYTLSGNTITMTEAPLLGDTVEGYRYMLAYRKLTLTSGAINGSNTSFDFSQSPTQVFWNGQKLTEGAAVNGYTLSGNTITMTEAPLSGDTVEGYGYVSAYGKLILTSGAIDGSNTSFDFDKPPLQVFWNGQKLIEGASVNGYTLSGITITVTEPPLTGDTIEAYGN